MISKKILNQNQFQRLFPNRQRMRMELCRNPRDEFI